MICTTCGNEIHGRICPFCETVQPGSPAEIRKKKQVQSVDLKSSQPNVEDALEKLKRELDLARSSGVAVVRVIHGWGSTGVGGIIAKAVDNQLVRLAGSGKIKNHIRGKDISPHNRLWQRLRDAYPEVSRWAKQDTENRGITLIEL